MVVQVLDGLGAGDVRRASLEADTTSSKSAQRGRDPGLRTMALPREDFLQTPGHNLVLSRTHHPHGHVEQPFAAP